MSFWSIFRLLTGSWCFLCEYLTSLRASCTDVSYLMVLSFIVTAVYYIFGNYEFWKFCGNFKTWKLKEKTIKADEPNNIQNYFSLFGIQANLISCLRLQLTLYHWAATLKHVWSYIPVTCHFINFQHFSN